MDVKKAYEIWAEHYDSNNNKTRDLEAIALREQLKTIQFDTCLEIGCGTGNGFIYIGELHSFKQYTGNKARFETAEGEQTVTCYTHNISEFTLSAEKYGFEIITINEFFDNNDRDSIPRLLTLLFRKRES